VVSVYVWESQQSNVVGFGEIYPISTWSHTSTYCCWHELSMGTLIIFIFVKRLFLWYCLKLRVSDICLYHVVYMILREWQFPCHLCQSKIYYSMNFIRYRIVSLSDRTRNRNRSNLRLENLAYCEDISFIGQCKYQWHLILSLNNTMSVFKLIVNRSNLQTQLTTIALIVKLIRRTIILDLCHIVF